MRKTFIIVFFAILCLSVFADDKKSLEKWAVEQRMPEEIDGVKIYRPIIANGKFSFGDYVNLETKLSDMSAFTRALVFAVNELDPETESIEAVDFDNKRFVVSRALTGEDGHNIYAFSEAFQIDGGSLSFMIPEIIVKYKDKLVINKRVPFQKLEPEKKEAHFAFVEEFSLLNSQFIAKMIDAIKNSNVEPIKDLTAVKAGKVVKGMNSTEVLVTQGKPDNITESGKLTKWMYGSYLIVIFSDGVVERVVNF